MKLVAIAVLIAACASAPHPAPVATWFEVPTEIGVLVIDDAEFARFARPLRAALETQLAHTPDDKDRRFVLAMLDALDGRWTEAVTELDRIRATERDKRKAIMTGLTIRLWASAREHGGETQAAFRAALEHAVGELPLPLVKDDLSMLREMGRAFTVQVCRQLVNQSVKADHGTISFEDTQVVVFQRYAATQLVQVGPVIDEVLGAHGIPLPSD
jgi:hypothetical protein